MLAQGAGAEPQPLGGVSKGVPSITISFPIAGCFHMGWHPGITRSFRLWQGAR